MSTSLIDRRLVELRLFGRPEQAEELALLEECKADGKLSAYERKRNSQRLWSFQNTNRLIRWKEKTP
jgi:hypothetical protein